MAVWRALEPATHDGSVERTAVQDSREATESTSSIAVLLFDNLSRDAANEAFTDGIHNDILIQISKIRDLKVIVQGGPTGGPPKEKPTRAKIAAVGAAYILEGSVHLAGNQVRITAQLIEAESDAQVWTDTYDRELTDTNIFSIQSDVAKSVADAVRATLSREEQH